MTTRMTTRSVVGAAGSITIKHESIQGTNAQIGPNGPVMIDTTHPPIGEATLAARSLNSEFFPYPWNASKDLMKFLPLVNSWLFVRIFWATKARRFTPFCWLGMVWELEQLPSLLSNILIGTRHKNVAYVTRHRTPTIDVMRNSCKSLAQHTQGTWMQNSWNMVGHGGNELK